jgi:hypothetical protein
MHSSQNLCCLCSHTCCVHMLAASTTACCQLLFSTMQPICGTVAAWAIVLARNPHKHVVSLSDPSGNFLFCAQNPHHGPPINPPVCLSQWHSQGNPPPPSPSENGLKVLSWKDNVRWEIMYVGYTVCMPMCCILSLVISRLLESRLLWGSKFQIDWHIDIFDQGWQEPNTGPGTNWWTQASLPLLTLTMMAKVFF